MGIFLSFLGVIILAPGGVLIAGADKQKHGKIALAGSLTNIILAGLGLGLFWLFPYKIFAQFGLLNAFFAVFNLLPVPPFDGYAVWQWNKTGHIASIALAGVLLIVAYA